jgi:acyl-coenzyme A thioesterase PaaI-like protein
MMDLPDADLPDAVFHLDGDVAVPTPLARGPWSASAQHGGAPAALLARTVERCDPGPADFVARLTIELLRPVPLEPLTVAARTTRPGKKVQWIEASLSADGVEVARATGLRLRTDELALPVPERETRDFAGPGDSEAFVITFTDDDERDGAVMPVGFWRAMDVHLATGSWTESGPSSVWFRLRVPVVAGEEPSPLQRVAAAADFGNGVSNALERGTYLFINPDLTIYLHRPPDGEWVGLDARTHAEANGVGLAESALHDEHGRIGRSLQSLLIDRL